VGAREGSGDFGERISAWMRWRRRGRQAGPAGQRQRERFTGGTGDAGLAAAAADGWAAHVSERGGERVTREWMLASGRAGRAGPCGEERAGARGPAGPSGMTEGNGPRAARL